MGNNHGSHKQTSKVSTGKITECKVKHVYDHKGMEITFILTNPNIPTNKKFWNIDYLQKFPQVTTVTFVFDDGYVHTVKKGKSLKLPPLYYL